MDSTIIKKQKIIVVCGVKNSGKTTLITKIVTGLTKRGLKIAVIKRDGHDFTCDIPNTDSYRIKEAGAYATAVFSDSRIFVHKTGIQGNEKNLIGLFPEADIIFIEGLKESAYPKIEVIRAEVSERPVSNPVGRFLIVTDRKEEEFNEPTTSFNDIEWIFEKIFEQ